MVNQLVQFHPLALCIPFIWVVLAYGRGAYVFPAARKACLTIVLLAVLSCCVIYMSYMMRLSNGGFPLFVISPLFVIVHLLLKYARLPGVSHWDILFLQSPIPIQESTVWSPHLPRGLGILLFMGTVAVSGVLFVGGILLTPCARLDTLFKVSGCQGVIGLDAYQFEDSFFLFAPNSQYVAVFTDPDRVNVGDVVTREIVWSATVNAEITAYAWSSNSVALAVSTADGRVLVYDAASGKLKNQMLYGESETMSLTFVADTPVLVVLGDKRHALVWDSNTGQVVTKIAVPSVSPGNVVSSSDRRWIALAFAGNVYVYDTTTWERQEPPLPGSSIGAWSPDAQKLITYEETIIFQHTRLSNQVWQSETVQNDRPLRGAFFSSDSRLFFWYTSFSYQLQGDKAELWNGEKKEMVFEYNSPNVSVEQIRVSPDSKTIGILRTQHWRDHAIELWTVDLK